MGELQEKGRLAKEASYRLAVMTTMEKNKGLLAMASGLEQACDEILSANEQDMQRAREKGQPQAFLDRLLLTEGRVQDMADGLRAVAELPDPVGHVEEMWLNKDNLQIGKVAVPLGVIGMIYEARPNVTADAAALCLKSGNAVLLRGSGRCHPIQFENCRSIKCCRREGRYPKRRHSIGGGYQSGNS